MLSDFKRFAATVAVTSAAIAVWSSGALAQNAEEIRAKCINQAAIAYPGNPEGGESRARVETYIVCMRQHGLTP